MSRLSTRILDCGMPLIVEDIPGVKSVAVSWLLPAGTATEPGDLQGMGSMWSELLLRGCGDLDSRAQADALDRLGISRGAESGTLFMSMSHTLVGDRLLDSLPIMVDMARRPCMAEDSIEPVRDLALQAIASLADDPQERAVLAVRERHNSPPLNRSGLGTVDGLKKLTRADLLDGWHARALPEGSIFAVAGAVGAAGGLDGIAKRLEGLLSGWRGKAPAIITTPSKTRGTYHHILDKSSQVQVVLMHDAPAEPHPDSIRERIINSVLSGGMSARLFTEVREKRALCYSVSESYAADREYGRCLAYVGTTPERAQESLDVLMSELNRINGTPPPPLPAPAPGKVKQAPGAVPLPPPPPPGITHEEFTTALVGIKSRIIFSGESTSGRAHALAADHHKRGRARSLDEISAAYDALTPDEINGYLARRTLGPTTIVTLGPAPLRAPIPAT